MTCIVGVVTNEHMIMGGDSAGVGGYNLTIRNDPKVFRVKQVNGPDALVGFTSSFRMGQLLMSLVLPEDDSKKGDREANFDFLVAGVIPVVRKIFEVGGYVKIVNNNERGGVFLLAYRNWIYGIEEDFQVASPATPYLAAGSGTPYALGALDYMYRYSKVSRMAPSEIVRRALNVAEKNNAAVRGPMKIIILPNSRDT